ncbi:MAG: hypothetical protein GY936_15950 [Ignavibacteriae bacterium]|nr:hypothetical protein [Ignavibacteriota bacterium]
MAANKKIFENSIDPSRSIYKSKFISYLLNPIKMGFFSFSILFSIILFVKLLNYFAAPESIFVINIYDVMISVIGFGLGFLLELTLQIRRKQNNSFD